ncbi:tripartite-type tricarboxylate transporter receptor subunit TctC [Bradyrhizobium sp. LB13.1]
MTNRRTLLLATLLLFPTLVSAQNYPAKPVKLIVPFPAGGPNDIIARVIGQRMSELSGQPVLIDNRGGQGGVLGTDAVSKAAPDGYTIAISSAGALAISPSMERVAYDTLNDLTPVTLVATVPEMLVVATNVEAKNIGELIALAKAQPGKLNFASSGPGSLPHLAGELFKLTARIDIVHVPYRGAAPAVNDLLGQQVQMTFLDLPVLLPQVKAGALRPIAVGSAERSATAPDVPTTAEAGFADLRIENWYGMVRTEGHAEGDRRSTAWLSDKGDGRSRGEGEARCPRGNAGRRRAGAFSAVHRGRDEEMGEGDQGRRGGDGKVAQSSDRRRRPQMLHQHLRRP